MKKLSILVAFFLSIFLFFPPPQDSGAAVSEQDKAKISAPRQLIINSGWEAGKASWESTGSAVFSIDSSTPLFGAKSATWDPSATGEFLRSKTAVVLDLGMKGKTCLLEMNYQWVGGVSGEIELQALDQTDAVLASIPLDPEADSAAAQLNFNCPDPSTTQVKWALASTADAALIEVDAAFIGTGKNDVSAIPRNSVETKILTADVTSNGDIAEFTYNNLEIGAVYELTGKFGLVVNSGVLDTTSQIDVNHDGGIIERIQFRVNDGGAAEDFSFFALSTKFTATAATLTFNANSMSVNSYISGSNANKSTSYVQLEKRNDLGGNFQEGLTLETSGEHWDVNIGGSNPNLGTVNVATYTEITDGALDMVINTGSSSAQIPCSTTNPSTGLVCGAGNEGIGIVLDIKTAGRYKICGQFSNISNAAVSTSTVNAFQWFETPNNAQTILQSGHEVSHNSNTPSTSGIQATGFPNRLCSNFDLLPGQRTIRLMYEQSVTGSIVSSLLAADRAGSSGQRDIHITVDKLDQQMPTPVFTDLTDSLKKRVQAPNATTEVATCAGHIETAGASGAIIQDPMSCIDSVSRTAAGDYTVSFTTSYFDSVKYACTIVGNDNAESNCSQLDATVNEVRARCYDAAGTLFDAATSNEGFEFICTGQKGN